MTAYTDATRIAAYLGTTLTADQQTQAAVVAQAASDWIDQYLGGGRTWQASTAVTDELHPTAGDRIFLNRRPVSAITQIKVRQPVVSAQWTVLGATQYELLDPAYGVVLIIGWGDYLAAVSYTHTANPAPSQVQLAASMIAANWMSLTLQPDSFGIDQIAVGQNDVNVKFSADAADVPAEAKTLLAGLRTIAIA